MTTSKPSTQTATERRAAEAETRRIITRFAKAHLKLTDSARRWLRKRLPTAHEVVYEYRSWFVISFSPSDRGYEGVFGVRGDADGVRLYFTQGKGLPDPDKVLQGTANTRYIELESASTLRRPAVVALFEAALKRNRVPFARTGRGPVVISASTTKNRRRSA